MESLKHIVKELYAFPCFKGTSLEEKHAYISILRSIIPEGSVHFPDEYQQAHRDFLSTMVDALLPTEQKPMTCLVAFEDFTKFCFYPKSHCGEIIDLCKDEKPIELILMKGEFVLFHAKLVHFGGAYTRAPGNLRLHIYLLSLQCGLGTRRDKDGTINPLTEHRPLGGGKKLDPTKVRVEKSIAFKSEKRAEKLAKKLAMQARGGKLGKLLRAKKVDVRGDSAVSASFISTRSSGRSVVLS